MFHWICPECGREIPPAMKECAVCDGQAEEGAAMQEGARGQGPEASKTETVNGRSPVTSETQDEVATVIRADERVDDQKPAAAVSPDRVPDEVVKVAEVTAGASQDSVVTQEIVIGGGQTVAAVSEAARECVEGL